MKSQEDFIDDEVVTEDDLTLYKLINIDRSYSDAENDLLLSDGEIQRYKKEDEEERNYAAFPDNSKEDAFLRLKKN